MKIKLTRPALIDELLIITSSVTRNTRRLVEAEASIALKDGTPVAEGKATMFVINTKQGIRRNEENESKSNAR